MPETNVTRREIKYLLDRCAASGTQRKLKLILPVDRPGPPAGYLVRSLYFDTLYDKDYYDKVDGLEARRKIRLRIYSPQDKGVKLEVKEKQGNDQWKRSATLFREEALLVVKGEYNKLLRKSSSPFLKTVLRKMELESYVPKAIVQFRRLAFVHPANSTRVTFDTELAATEASFDLFSEALPLLPILYPVILEVKYSHFLLSHIREMLDLADQVPVSTSKYCLGRQISFY